MICLLQPGSAYWASSCASHHRRASTPRSTATEKTTVTTDQTKPIVSSFETITKIFIPCLGTP